MAFTVFQSGPHGTPSFQSPSLRGSDHSCPQHSLLPSARGRPSARNILFPCFLFFWLVHPPGIAQLSSALLPIPVPVQAAFIALIRTLPHILGSVLEPVYKAPETLLLNTQEFVSQFSCWEFLIGTVKISYGRNIYIVETVKSGLPLSHESQLPTALWLDIYAFINAPVCSHLYYKITLSVWIFLPFRIKRDWYITVIENNHWNSCFDTHLLNCIWN